MQQVVEVVGPTGTRAGVQTQPFLCGLIILLVQEGSDNQIGPIANQELLEEGIDEVVLR